MDEFEFRSDPIIDYRVSFPRVSENYTFTRFSHLTGVTALWSLSKTHLFQLSTGSTQEDPSRITERLLSGRKESNQTNKQTKPGFLCNFYSDLFNTCR